MDEIRFLVFWDHRTRENIVIIKFVVFWDDKNEKSIVQIFIVLVIIIKTRKHCNHKVCCALVV